MTSYAYLTVAKHALGTEAYGPLGVLWAVFFTAGLGFFLPLEQEVSRALAARRTLGQGAGPLLRRATLLGAGLLALLLAVLAGFSPVVVEHLFSGQWLLLVGLVLGLVGYWMEHLSRGAVSGLGRFRPYSVIIGMEGVFRVVGCVVLAVAGVRTAGLYGVVLGAAPIVAVVVGMRGQRDIVTPGPDAPWSELSSSLGALLAASVLAQALVNAGVPAIELLASEAEKDQVGTFFVGVVIARLPLFLFQAVQAALLPKLSALASAGRLDDFRSGFRRLVKAVAAVGVVGIVGTVLAGPLVVDVAFAVEIGRGDLGLLAAGSAAYMLALAMAQALIALHGQNQAALSWLAAIAGFLVATVVLSGLSLFPRIELALLAGSVVALGCMAWFVHARTRAGATMLAGDLIEALHDLPLEP